MPLPAFWSDTSVDAQRRDRCGISLLAQTGHRQLRDNQHWIDHPPRLPMQTCCSSRPPRTVALAAWLLMGYGVLSLLRLWWFGAGLPATATGWLIWAVALLVFAAVSRSLENTGQRENTGQSALNCFR